MRRALQVAFASLVFCGSSVALAEPGGNCPPGSWFCADISVPGNTQNPKGLDNPKDSKDTKDTPKAKPAKDPPKRSLAPSDGPSKPSKLADDDDSEPKTTVVIHTEEAPPPPPVVVVERPVRHEVPPPPPRRRHVEHPEWGFNMHFLAAMMGHSDRTSGDNGMGGLGFAFRVRPVGIFALDLGLDFVGGSDYNGYRRSEMPFSINSLIFVNPRDRAQVYVMAGFGWSSARVETAAGQTESWDYFGFQTGLGLEYRITKHVAINADLLGFIRGRTDDAARQKPEFTDPTTGRTSNTSGGGLLRGGLTLYWLSSSIVGGRTFLVRHGRCGDRSGDKWLEHPTARLHS